MPAYDGLYEWLVQMNAAAEALRRRRSTQEVKATHSWNRQESNPGANVLKCSIYISSLVSISVRVSGDGHCFRRIDKSVESMAQFFDEEATECVDACLHRITRFL